MSGAAGVAAEVLRNWPAEFGGCPVIGRVLAGALAVAAVAALCSAAADLIRR